MILRESIPTESPTKASKKKKASTPKSSKKKKKEDGVEGMTDEVMDGELSDAAVAATLGDKPAKSPKTNAKAPAPKRKLIRAPISIIKPKKKRKRTYSSGDEGDENQHKTPPPSP